MMRGVLRGAGIALVVALGMVPASAQTPRAPTAAERAVELEMLRLTNLERAKEGLPELKADERLAEAARSHSLRMAAQHLLAHRLADEPELKVRVDEAGVSFDSVAENVSVTNAADPSTSAHTGLMGSPGHRANILGSASNAMGVGVIRVGDTYWITEDFAHSFPRMTAATLERSLGELVTAMRFRRGLRELKLIRLANEARACRDDATPAVIGANLPGARNAIVFTTWTLETLPRPVLEAAGQRELEALAIHACPLDAGQFKIVAVFF